jgi:hypothetical protein
MEIYNKVQGFGCVLQGLNTSSDNGFAKLKSLKANTLISAQGWSGMLVILMLFLSSISKGDDPCMEAESLLCKL